MAGTSLVCSSRMLAPRTGSNGPVQHPWVWFALIVSLAAAAMIGQALIIPIAAMLLVPILICGDLPSLKRSLDTRAERRALRQRRELRETRLENAQVRRDGLFELTGLVDSIVSNGASKSEQTELEELLDHYVDVAVTRAQCQAAVMATDRTSLGYALNAISPRSPQAELRRTLIERRIACWTQARDRSQMLDEELAVTAELVRLLAQKSALAGIDHIDLDAITEHIVAQLEEISVEEDA